MQKFKRILITGSEGFIGGYLIKKLKKNNKNKIFGSYYKNNKNKIKGVNYIKCDVRNKSKVKKVLKKIKPNIIFHLAAKSHPYYSFKNPHETIYTNVTGTINIFEASIKLSSKPTIVVACSSGQYGSRDIKKLPMKENDTYEPEHIYGLSKVFQDLLSLQYFKMYRLKVIRAIIFNTSGPGKKHDVFFDLIKQFKKQIRKKYIKIRCGNLNNFRDFMHVEDVADALIKISQKGKSGEAYNIGSSKLQKISTIIYILKKKYKKNIKLIKDLKLFRKFDEKFIMSNNNKIKKIGWKPKKNLEDIISDMLKLNVN